jgi:hypothetical protein
MSIFFFEGAAAQLQYRNTVVVDIGLGLGGWMGWGISGRQRQGHARDRYLGVARARMRMGMERGA